MKINAMLEDALDEYTEKAKNWLNERFRQCDKNDVYFAHQPIYGFRNDPCEPGHVYRYLITYRLLKLLAHLKFESLLDVGGAEGYKAFLVRKFFNVSVENTDLSDEACKRAREIFNIKSTPSDIHELPYADNQFDVVMCSEALEHVTDWNKAIAELTRVARKAVVITVPHEHDHQVELNKANNIIHSHIHHFDSTSMTYLKANGYTVISHKIYSPLLVIPAALVDANQRTHDENWRHPKIVTQIYNLLATITKIIFGKRTASFLVWLDSYMCKIFPFYNSNLVIILKDKNCFLQKETYRISPKEIIEFSVPYHYLTN